MYKLARRLLFLLAPEAAHHLGLLFVRFIGFLHRNKVVPSPNWAKEDILKTQSPFGELTSPVGLAAGLDKNAVALWGWQALGFGFVEVGTITPREQPGQDRPRLFRFPQWLAIVNRMGFNNHGAFQIAQRLRSAKEQGLAIKVGGNIGKNFNTPIENAAEDFRKVAMLIYPHVDYMVINVSSPNTPGLRDLQKGSHLDLIVEAVKREAPMTPLFIKIAPDQAQNYIADVLTVCAKHKVSGVICGNTLLNHAQCSDLSEYEILKLPQGGLSGAPILETNLNLARLYCDSPQKPYVIGVGGITTPEDAIKYFETGCKLIQIYTGFIYKGPKLLREIIRALKR